MEEELTGLIYGLDTGSERNQSLLPRPWSELLVGQ